MTNYRMKNMTLVGFKDEAELVKRVAAKLKIRPQFADEGVYRAGEHWVKGPAKPRRRVLVVANVRESPDSIFRLHLLSFALRHAGARRVGLLAPWIAYGRQDRPSKPGDAPAGSAIGEICEDAFDKIVTLDAHSPTFIGSFDGKLVNVTPWPELTAGGFDLVAAPDRGATERASLAADAMGVPFIVIEKTRVGKKVAAKTQAGTSVKGARILLVDDMADSGGTLVAAAKALKKAGASKVAASVTHAIDLKRLKSILAAESLVVTAFFDHAGGKLAEGLLDGMVRKLT